MRRLSATLIPLLAMLALGAAAATAKTGRCLGDGTGPTCHFWSGRVDSVGDGDTIDVRIAGVGKRRVRLADVQAMEQSVYSFKHPKRRRGDCHAVEATARIESLLRAAHWRVRLSAQNPGSRAGHRLLRSVAVRRGGRWRDVGEILMREGHTIWLAGSVEYAWNQRYLRAEEEAQRAGANMWNPVHCGSGPSQQVPLRLWVSWDPVSSDVEHLNDEWIKIQNRSTTDSISLDHWWVRDAMLRRFTFPAGTVLRPGETATVHAGHGDASGTDFFWGLPSPPFQNPGDYRHLGDGGYLFDPHGDLRAAMVYPCVVACASPDQGAVRISVQPRGTEYATFQNVSGHDVDLYGYAMTIAGSSYPFGPGSRLAPGQSVRVFIEGDPADDTATDRHWGLSGRMLPDGGGWVRLATFTDVTLSCTAWGAGRC